MIIAVIIRALLTLVMGVLYYVCVAPLVTLWTFFIQFANQEVRLGSYIVIWGWPIIMMVDAERAIKTVDKAMSEAENGNNQG